MGELARKWKTREENQQLFIAAGVETADLYVPNSGQAQCELRDHEFEIINGPRCPRRAWWRGSTVCVHGHETLEYLCEPHKKLAAEGGAWWKCDVCHDRAAKTTAWARL